MSQALPSNSGNGLLTGLRICATVLALGVVIWNYLAPQPHIQLGEVRTRALPSTVSPGVVELVVRNGGSIPAHVVASTAGHLASVSPSAQQLSSGGVEAELTRQLQAAAALPPDGTTEIPVGQTMRLKVEIAPSQRSWFIARGEATMVVTARLRYRDRLFSRETMFCLFANRAGQWSPCPFLNG